MPMDLKGPQDLKDQLGKTVPQGKTELQVTPAQLARMAKTAILDHPVLQAKMVFQGMMVFQGKMGTLALQALLG